MSRSDYFEHYLQHHAPLGLRLAKAIAGYTVNLTDLEDPGSGGPDAITEIWTPSAEGFLDPDRAFDTPEDAAVLSADHDSFMGPFDVYVVDETIVRRRSSFAPLGTRTTLAKRVSLYGHGEQPPEPPAEVVEVVEHRVLRRPLRWRVGRSHRHHAGADRRSPGDANEEVLRRQRIPTTGSRRAPGGVQQALAILLCVTSTSVTTSLLVQGHSSDGSAGCYGHRWKSKAPAGP